MGVRRPNTLAVIRRGEGLPRLLVGEYREAGLRGAREWRERNRSYFDALYPETINPVCCAACGQRLRERDDA